MRQQNPVLRQKGIALVATTRANPPLIAANQLI
jgi:hypothetical protein